LANYSEQFLLSDNEREKLTKLCMKKMIENIKWYHKIGFKKFKKVNEKGFNRVYFQKQLF